MHEFSCGYFYIFANQSGDGIEMLAKTGPTLLYSASSIVAFVIANPLNEFTVESIVVRPLQLFFATTGGITLLFTFHFV